MSFNLQIEGNVSTPITRKVINRAENELGFTFPDSYVNFVMQYGGGLLCGLFNILVPNTSSTNIDIVARNKELKSLIKENIEAGFWDDAKDISKEWLLSLEPFGTSDNGDIMCWDVNKKDERGEYEIYLLENEQNEAPLVAKNLDEFIQGFCLDQKIDEIFPMGQGEKWNLQATFKPF